MADCGRQRLRSSTGSLLVPHTKTRMRQLQNTRTPAGQSGHGVTTLPAPSNLTSSALQTTEQTNLCSVNGADPSVLRPSLQVNVTGMKQAVKVLENGSPEIRDYLLNECNILFECRTCLNMFRSIANLVAHKRSFCKARLQDVRHVYRRDPGEYSSLGQEEQHLPGDAITAVVQQEAVETAVPDEEWDLKNYSPSLELLKEAGFLKEIEPPKPQLWTKKNSLQHEKSSLKSVVERLKSKALNGPESDFYSGKEQSHVIGLERIASTEKAVFQNIDHIKDKPSMGQRYLELQKLKKKPPVLLGPHGKIIQPGVPNFAISGGEIVPKTASKIYPCVLCKREFREMRGVSRHLIRYHKKTDDEVKKYKKLALKHSRIDDEPEEKSSYPIFCHKCLRVFSARGPLNIHKSHCRSKPKQLMIKLKRSSALDSANSRPKEEELIEVVDVSDGESDRKSETPIVIVDDSSESESSKIEFVEEIPNGDKKPDEESSDACSNASSGIENHVKSAGKRGRPPKQCKPGPKSKKRLRDDSPKQELPKKLTVDKNFFNKRPASKRLATSEEAKEPKQAKIMKTRSHEDATSPPPNRVGRPRTRK